MAYRQYIGARYVPLLDGAWDATKNYEPLTVVDDANGNSYTSKKYVPAGTPLTDRTYWQLTASFSGALERLRRDVNQSQNDINSLNGRVNAAEEEIIKINDVGEVLTVSDSYGTITNSSNKTAADLFGEYCGVTVRQFAQGGARFKDGSLLAGLQQFIVPDASKIKTVIIFCGANDAWGAEEDIVSGISDMVAFIRSAYTNAKKIVLCGCGLTMGTMNGSAPEREKVVNAYIRGAYINGITYLENSEAVLHNTALLQSDGVHPTTTDGVIALSMMLSAAYMGDTVSVHEKIDVIMTPSPESPEHLSLQTGVMTMSIDNDVVRMQAKSTEHGLIGFNSGATGKLRFERGVFYTICNLDNTMIDGIITNVNTFFSINGIVHIYGGDSIPGSLVCCIQDKKLKGMLLAKYLGDTVEDVVAFTSIDMEITLPVNRY